MQIEKIGKYEVREVLGQGNMGVVYLGHDPFSDEDVAIKVCSIQDEEAGPDANRVARKLFFNEAHTAGALEHPNVLKVFDAGEQDGHPYIVMEYIEDARTLKDYTEPDNLLPIRKVVEIVYQCAKALSYAHRHGVVHRDIKATNIMLTSDGTAKIGDFGIAQYALAEQTQVMGMLGSPRYMSPEQAREEEVDQQTDLYSLGVVCYEMLCGSPPHSARSFAALIKKLLNEEPTPLAERRPDVPTSLAETVHRAMAKDRSERYSDAQELAIDLATAFHDVGTPPEALTDEQKYHYIRALDFFTTFEDAEVMEVSAICEWMRFGQGEKILNEGSFESAFYVIVAGEVAVMKGSRRISALGAGDCFGEMGYLARAERTASISALEDVTLIRISATVMERASMGCQLRFNQVFLQTLIARLARTSTVLSSRG